MNRAIVLIGVAKTGGGLSLLQSVEQSLDTVELWARRQGMPSSRILRFSDKLGTRKVEPGEILRAIRDLAELATVEQLIVYFSGHGIVNNRQEYWLLSDAPEDANAAVNLVGSIALAEGGAFQHVVIISDACRSQAPDLRSARINGSDIFPNIRDTQLSRSVDVFFATSLGAPALEVAVSCEHGPTYHSVYSEAMVDALSGRIHEIIKEGFIRPHPLKKHLPAIVHKRLLALELPMLVSQFPDARITSDPDEAWIATVDAPISETRPGAAGPLRGSSTDLSGPMSGAEAPDSPTPEPIRAPDLESNARQLVRAAIRRSSLESISTPELAFLRVELGLAEQLDHASISPGRSSPHGGAISVVGNAIKAVHGVSNAKVTTNQVSVQGSMQPRQVLVELADGSGLLIPVFGGYAVTATFANEGLSDISFIEPYPLDDDEARNLRELRAVIKAASSKGLFALERDDASELARRMQNSKFQDPAMAVFAAYAYQELGMLDRIRKMQSLFRNQFGVRLFDLELLGRGLLGTTVTGHARILPGVPLLSQGWAFAAALGGSHAARLRELRAHLLPSIWSHFSPAGTELLRRELRAEVDSDPVLAPTESTP